LPSEEEGQTTAVPGSASRLLRYFYSHFPPPPYVILTFHNQGPRTAFLHTDLVPTVLFALACSGLGPWPYITSRDYVTILSLMAGVAVAHRASPHLGPSTSLTSSPMDSKKGGLKSGGGLTQLLSTRVQHRMAAALIIHRDRANGFAARYITNELSFADQVISTCVAVTYE
jgi:hypothetical protein